jgi:methylmalonyl-CoA mutase
METMYQRSKSKRACETLKHTGELVGNTFLSSKDHYSYAEVIRATEEEKQFKFFGLHKANAKQVQVRLEKIQDAAIKNENLFI